MLRSLLSLALASLLAQSNAQVTGSASGFAAGVTGGGDATPATPADIDELNEWLTDDTPRVIMLDKTYDFSGSEGTATETGCIPDSNTCGSSGQNALDGPDWCSADYPAVEVTYDVAAAEFLDIKGDKSIVGVGDAGVIKGKGFRLSGGVSNVIFQNVHFTDLNPQYIWGGDALTLVGTDMVWIDHCKFSLVGRQMIVTGYEQAGRVTISNNEFDGVTEWSASCNNDHYWTMLFLGDSDKITLSNNYIHDTSGRSPKVGGSGDITMHAVNNYWYSEGGHAFDVHEGGKVLIEGNIMQEVDTPITESTASGGGSIFNVPGSSAAATCSEYIGRECQVNSIVDSGDFPSYTATDVLSAFADVAENKTTCELRRYDPSIPNNGMPFIMAQRLFPKLTATPLQATAYLGGIALFSISFLVFLNSTISFVVTDVIGQHEHVGNDVGTLGFADELLALVACPLWGLLSDRIGVRRVAVTGYIIVGASLILLVKSTNVYPELILGRLGFSLGGAACSTMVTAVLPAMVAKRTDSDIEEAGTAPKNVHNEEGHAAANGHAARLLEEERPGRNGSIGHGPSPSVSSEITITPGRYSSQSRTRGRDGPRDAARTPDENASDEASGTSQLAGLVGFFTGAGALVALLLFLPLPAYFQDRGEDRPQSVRISFYIVGAIAFCVALFIFGGLRNLPGENEKSFSNLWRQPYDETTHRDERGQLHITLTPAPSYLKLVAESLKLGFTDPSIGLGYLGGFVARASSVGISLFIPLFVNAYFVRNGLCTSNPDNLTDIKENCKRAYTLASALTGIAETAALICAPLFGWLGGKVVNGRSEWPLLGAAAIGVGGYVAFGMLRNPDAFHSEGGRWAFLAVIMIGISQIGSIVCSLGLLGRGISRGSLFDSWTAGAPFFMLALFNGVLFVAVALVGAVNAVKASRNGIAGRGDDEP
ncbi:hypothetical protein BTJ68_03750 [Hortaea werneckii EXF-2000]|uniref:pectin lyase n=1 Tax=Hortaea werneckii EXF-2000 TaxID=1157616 RepID=A0A1Z5TLQ7_HORWE|nr:hypothetical protein BTJ68_03750 [Hortaea werneckii EXF-2000]